MIDGHVEPAIANRDPAASGSAPVSTGIQQPARSFVSEATVEFHEQAPLLVCRVGALSAPGVGEGLESRSGQAVRVHHLTHEPHLERALGSIGHDPESFIELAGPLMAPPGPQLRPQPLRGGELPLGGSCRQRHGRIETDRSGVSMTV